MSGFSIKYTDMYQLLNAYKSKINSLMNHISDCQKKIQVIINDSDFTGLTAESVKAYLNEVHMTLLSSLNTTAQSMLDNIALYKAGYYAIDSATNFVLTEESMQDFRSILNSRLIQTESYGGQVNNAISSVSDLISFAYPDSGAVESSHDEISTSVVNLVSGISEQESSTQQAIENSSGVLISQLKACISKLDTNWTDIKSYQSNSFYSDSDVYALARLSQAFYEQHEENQDIYDQIWDMEDQLAAEAEARETEGIWKTVDGVTRVAIGAMCIVATAGAATPIVIVAGAAVGTGTAIFGISDAVEGSQEIYYGNIGDIDTESVNLLKSEVFQGNEEAYQFAENIFSFTASAMIPIGQASAVGKLTFRSGAVTVGKLAISDAAGAGASKITMDATGNTTAAAIAGIAASMATGFGLNAADKRFSISTGTVSTDDISVSSWYNEDGTINYPPNDGAVSGTETTISLKEGDTVGRYGSISDQSVYVTQPGVDPDTLSLPPTTDPSTYQEFLVVKEISQTIQSEVAAWGGSIGGGLQYKLPYSIQELIRKGFMVPK